MAAGGDGTVRCAAEILSGTDTALGLVPLGTGSRIDVIQAVLDHEANERLFLGAAGLGYDAAIMGYTVDGIKDRAGWLAYVEPGVRHLPGKPETAKVTLGGKRAVRHRVRGMMVDDSGELMCGGQIFPGASITDSILDRLILAPRADSAGRADEPDQRDPATPHPAGRRQDLLPITPRSMTLTRAQ